MIFYSRFVFVCEVCYVSEDFLQSLLKDYCRTTFTHRWQKSETSKLLTLLPLVTM